MDKKKLEDIYKYSGTYRLFHGLWKHLDKQLENSRILQFFSKEWNIYGTWKCSLFYKLVVYPVKLIALIADKVRGWIATPLKESVICRNIFSLASEKHCFSTRDIGLFLLALSVTEGSLAVLFRHNEWKYILLRMGIVIVAAGLFWINKPLNRLYEGSWSLKTMMSFFKNQES